MKNNGTKGKDHNRKVRKNQTPEAFCMDREATQGDQMVASRWKTLL